MVACPLVDNFACSFCRLVFCFVFKIKFFEKIFQKYHQSNTFDPEQVRHFIGPDLGPNSLQKIISRGH